MAKDARYRLAVKALCVYNKKILLISAHWKSHRSLPWGGVQIGEHFEQALQRELAEEITYTGPVNAQFLTHKNIVFTDTSNGYDSGCFLYYFVSFWEEFVPHFQPGEPYDIYKRATYEQVESMHLGERHNKPLVLKTLLNIPSNID